MMMSVSTAVSYRLEAVQVFKEGYASSYTYAKSPTIGGQAVDPSGTLKKVEPVAATPIPNPPGSRSIIPNAGKVPLGSGVP